MANFERRVTELVAQIELMGLSDDELSRVLNRNKSQPQQGKFGESAFAVIREAIFRVMGKRVTAAYFAEKG